MAYLHSIVFTTSTYSEFGTPQWLFDKLNLEFHFTLDACASKDNFKVPRYYSIDGTGIGHNGLAHSWAQETVFCNPPYQEAGAWIKKGCEEAKNPGTICVFLVYSRTDTQWFHTHCLPHGELRFLQGRLKFDGAKYSAPFGSLLCVFPKHRQGRDGMAPVASRTSSPTVAD